eukprot:TRINITY_DN50760_c0_g1_i1.p1 TRINITY_DN50760_c0_g1~~TRINITY_DN50760_c0_g1_i1.p1  ORF type:complete len:215 (+),score=49.16 TRINITY_DN50760_c0_g1_i1:172-816(+)
MRLVVVDVTGTTLFDDDVSCENKVVDVRKRCGNLTGWAMDEALYMGSKRLEDSAALDSIPEGATLCLVSQSRSEVFWTSSVDGSRETAKLQDFEPTSVVKPPLVKVISGKGCGEGASQLHAQLEEVATFEPPVEATEALAATPFFRGKESWTLKFMDGSSLFYRPEFEAGPLYTAIEGEERRITTLGLEYIEEDGENGRRKGWQVPVNWSYKPY